MTPDEEVHRRLDLDDCLEVIAYRVITEAVNRAGGGTESWEDHPNIGQHDWEKVVDRVSQLIIEMDPGEDAYWEAYELLGDRVER